MSAKRFSIRFSQLGGLVMFASLFIWSSVVLAGCDDTVTSGLVGCYPLDGNVNDASPSANHGVEYGNLEYATSGVIDKAKTFTVFKNGKKEVGYFTVKNLAIYENNPFSIAFWWIPPKEVTPDGSLNHYSFFSIGADPLVYGPYLTLLTSTKRLSVRLRGNTLYTYTTDLNAFSNSKELVVNFKKPYFITLTYRDKELNVYVNGEPYTKYEITRFFLPTSYLKALDTILVGGDGVAPSGGGYPLYGSLDQLRIYNRTLAPEEVVELYNEPNRPTCLSATYTNGVLQVPFIQIEGVTDSYKATLQQYSSSFAFQVTQSTIVTGKKSSCPATYSTKTGIGVLHIPLVKTKTTLPPNTPQCYDVTLQEFSNRFQLDLEQVKLTPCP